MWITVAGDFQKADIAIFYWRVHIVLHCILEVTDWQVKVRQALAAWGDEARWDEGSDLRYQGTEGCYGNLGTVSGSQSLVV